MSSTLLGSHHLFSILFFIVLIGAGSQYNNSSPMLLYFSRLGKQSYSLYFTHLLLLKLTFIICTNYYSISGYFLLLLNFVLILLLSLIMSNFVFNKIDIYFVDKAKAIYQSKVKI